jgi:hypothetical protein
VSARKHGYHSQEDTITFARNSKLDVPDYAFYPLLEIVVVQRNPVYVRVTQRIISYSCQRSVFSRELFLCTRPMGDTSRFEWRKGPPGGERVTRRKGARKLTSRKHDSLLARVQKT